MDYHCSPRSTSPFSENLLQYGKISIRELSSEKKKGAKKSQINIQIVRDMNHSGAEREGVRSDSLTMVSHGVLAELPRPAVP